MSQEPITAEKTANKIYTELYTDPSTFFDADECIKQITINIKNYRHSVIETLIDQLTDASKWPGSPDFGAAIPWLKSKQGDNHE